MDFLWDKITEWLKEMLVGGIVSNLSSMFDATNEKVAEISGQVGLTPQAWNGGIFNMIQNLSETVIVPIAGAILAFVMTLHHRQGLLPFRAQQHRNRLFHRACVSSVPYPLYLHQRRFRQQQFQG